MTKTSTKRKKITKIAQIKQELDQIHSVVKMVEKIYLAKTEKLSKDMQAFVLVMSKNKDGTWFMSSSLKNISHQVMFHAVCASLGLTYLDGSLILAKMHEGEEKLKKTSASKKKK